MFKKTLLLAALAALASDCTVDAKKEKAQGAKGGRGGGGGKKPKPEPVDPDPVPDPVDPDPVPDQVLDPNDVSKFSDFANKMASDGGNYVWKSYKAFSGASGQEYELNMFRIVGDANGDTISAPNGPILLTHGFASDSITWFGGTAGELAFGTKLADAGYDVWYANLRGTRYSRQNQAWNADSNASSYWNYDLNDYAEEDVPAMVKKIIEVAGDCKKVSIVGHSLGAQAQINMLSKTTQATKYVAQSLNLAPCIVADANSFLPGVDAALYNTVESSFGSLGYYSLFGPNWGTQTFWLCFFSGYGAECDLLQSIETYNASTGTGFQEVCLQVLLHLTQIYLADRFQEFDSNINDSTLSPEILFTDLKVPSRFMWMDNDTLCPEAKQKTFLPSINAVDEDNFARDHYYPAGANDATFMASVFNLLSNSGEDIASGDCTPITGMTAAGNIFFP